MVVVRDDVVAWYELHREEESGTTYDEHARLDGTVSGATLSNDAPSSNFIGSFEFDGTNDWIDISDTGFDQNNFTIMGWIKFDTSHFGEIVSYADASNNDNYIRLGVTSDNKFLFRENDGVSNREYRTTATFSTGTWYHVAFVKDTDYTNVKIYVNGSDEALTTTISGTPSVTGLDNLDIGRLGRSSPADYFDGHMSGLKIFNKPATSTEVSADYNSGDGVTYRSFFSLSDNLEAYYKLDGNANDATGNGNNGTISGATSTSTDAVIGTCYDFDGTNDYISLPMISASQLNPLTYGAWVTFDALSTRNAIIGASTSGSNDVRDYFYLDSSGRLNFDNFPPSGGVAVSTGSVSTGTRTHVGMTFDGSEVKFFINGELDSTVSYSEVFSGTTPTQYTIGARVGNGGNIDHSNARIDELLVSSRKFSEGEMRRLYSFGAGLRYEDLDSTSPLVDGVVSAYNFNGDVLDAKNNTYDGTNNGTTDVAGLIDRGRDGDGTADYISFPTLGIFTDPFSIGMWTNSDATTTDEGFFAARGERNVYLQTDQSTGNKFLGVIGSSGAKTVTSTTTISNGTCYNPYIQWDGSTLALGVNGVEEDTIASGTPDSITNTNTFFSLDGSIRFANAQIDIPTIWSRALSSTEWNAFYNGGSGTEFPFSGTLFSQELTETVTLTQDLDQTDYVISGTVTLSGSPQSGVTVILINDTDNTYQADTTTDVNGDYSFNLLDVNDTFHVAVQYDDAGTKYNDESKPYITPVSSNNDLDGA